MTLLQLTLLASVLLPCAGFAADIRATLVTDADPRPLELDSSASGFYVKDSRLYFSAWRNDVGYELFSTDGSAAQPMLVADLVPQTGSSSPYVLGAIGSTFIISVKHSQDDDYRYQVLALDTLSGQTVQLAEFQPQLNIYTWRIDRVGEFAGRVAFTDLLQGKVWTTDGTAAGTQLIYTPDPLDASPSTRTACMVSGQLLFLGRSGDQRQLWVSDGTPAGTQSVTDIAESGFTVDAATASNGCYFLTQRNNGRALWFSDGTAAGTSQLRQWSSGWPYEIALLGDEAYLMQSVGSGVQLIRASQSQPVASFAHGFGQLLSAGSRLAFITSEGSGYGVKISDGSAAGTRSASLNGQPLVLGGLDLSLRAEGGRFFARNNEALYAIDPATAEATALGAFNVFGGNSESASLGGIAIGIGQAPGSGRELWRSDGTPAGTRLLHDIAQSSADGIRLWRPDSSVVRGDTVYFLNGASGESMQLWRTDGSAAGTRGLAPELHGGGSLVDFAALGDDFLVTRQETNAGGTASAHRVKADFSAGSLLWSPLTERDIASSGDGTSAQFFCGTVTAAENLCGLRSGDLQASVLAPGGEIVPYPQEIGGIGAVALTLFRGRLWRSDGTLPGTFELQPGVAVSRVSGDSDWQVPGRLLFTACTGVNGTGCGAYVSDGSVAGTQRIAEIEGRVSAAAKIGASRALFAVGDGIGELWSSDGTAAGTLMLREVGVTSAIAVAGTTAHLIGYSSGALRYVVSDGTAAGTRIVPMTMQLDFASRPVALDADTVVFGCYTRDSGSELCSVDGNGDNLRIAADIWPGPASSAPTFAAQTAQGLYFSANDGIHGSELWRAEILRDAIFADGLDGPR